MTKDTIYNKPTTRLITVNGCTFSVADWSRELGKNVKTLYTRLRRGWHPVSAIKRPVRSYTKHV
jgi:hypothetical protein